jgi:hypothetical protein
MFLRRPLLMVALLLTACGPAKAVATAVACATPTPIPAPSMASPPYTAVADVGRVDPGGTVTFTETVEGPASLQVDCAQPLTVVVTDSTGLSVYSGSSAQAQGDGLCGQLSLAGGTTQAYEVSWPVDSSLPGGDYRAALVLGDAPPLILTVAVGVIPASC